MRISSRKAAAGPADTAALRAALAALDSAAHRPYHLDNFLLAKAMNSSKIQTKTDKDAGDRLGSERDENVRHISKLPEDERHEDLPVKGGMKV
jgi:hypothetical protein